MDLCPAPVSARPVFETLVTEHPTCLERNPEGYAFSAADLQYGHLPPNREDQTAYVALTGVDKRSPGMLGEHTVFVECY